MSEPVVPASVSPLSPPSGEPLVAPASAGAPEAVAPAAPAAPLGLPAAARQLASSFALRPLEQMILQTLLASPRPLTVRQLRRRLGLTPAEVASLLPPTAPLRAHALVETHAAATLGLLRESCVLHPARGLYALWHGLGQGAPGGIVDALASQLPGARVLSAPPPGTSGSDALRAERAPTALAELVREQLVAHQPRLLWLSGCGGATLLSLAGAARARLLRPALLLDARALVGWPVATCYAALLRLRRDADLRGAVLVVAEAPLLGAALYALLGPRAPGHSAPLVLASSGAMPTPPWLPEPAGEEIALSLREVDLRPVLAPAPAGSGAAPGALAAAPEDALSSASREDARRKAVLDAARAMGKPLPADFQRPAAPPAPASPERPATEPARPAPRWEPAASTPAPAEPSPPSAVSSRPRPASADSSPRLEALEATAGRPAEPAPELAPATGVDASGEAQPAAASAVSPAPIAEPAEPAEPGPDPDPLPLSAEPSVNEVALVARTTPNSAQRMALLKELAGKKSQAVILAFRQNLGSPHPGVRAAAEAGMTSIFGPDWNRARTIAPPIQPPRSDDGGRGPHGAF